MKFGIREWWINKTIVLQKLDSLLSLSIIAIIHLSYKFFSKKDLANIFKCFERHGKCIKDGIF